MSSLIWPPMPSASLFCASVLSCEPWASSVTSCSSSSILTPRQGREAPSPSAGSGARPSDAC
eukprot:9010348-Pyramimonas_sp.AAC.1